MTKKVESEWQLLAQHEKWVVEYRDDSQIIRMSLNSKVMHLEREAYQLLWGVITQGLDELERVEDESARIRELSHANVSEAVWSQTRH
jgi:recombinational DNA repair protein RecR